MTDAGTYPIELRNWRRGLCALLGINPTEILSIADEDAQHGSVTVSWRATSEQAPSLGTAELGDSGSADQRVHTGSVLLLAHQWHRILDSIGAKPRPELGVRHLE